MQKKTSDEEQPHARSQSLNSQGLCGAKTRSGKPCRSLMVAGKKRCRMHGGAPGSGAPLGNKNAKKHGLFSAEWLQARATIHRMMKHIDKNGEVNLDMTREESLQELISDHLDFKTSLII